MSYSKFIRTNDPVRPECPRSCAAARQRNRGIGKGVHGPQTSDGGEGRADHRDELPRSRSRGGSGESQSLPPIPKWATMLGSVAMQVASQLLHLGREPDPPTPTKPVAPPEWVANTDHRNFASRRKLWVYSGGRRGTPDGFLSGAGKSLPSSRDGEADFLF